RSSDLGAIDDSKIIEIGGYRFEVGLLEGIGKDHSIVGDGVDHPLSHGSEWNRLMYNVALPLGTTDDIRDSQIGDQWANYPQTNVADGLWLTSGHGNRTWCKEVWPSNSNWRVSRGNGFVSSLYSYTSSRTYSISGWRPRLKLITQ